MRSCPPSCERWLGSSEFTMPQMDLPASELLQVEVIRLQLWVTLYVQFVVMTLGCFIVQASNDVL